ncbi:putative lipoprotein [Myxococcus xanthus DK 1622]|uniref:Lipoprotein n=2 Tax=Myxococcaceae TaxID=31 RepID=Q1D7A0_MYXXD|nr:putative lipoprotein [Myxococcus xanthus DK 1622]NOJ57597.1 hypothetical protein [Myxococcus xanthus]QVW65020.1 hypothetical protein JTM82_21545 [Myxococcus xanthus DZ2]QDE90202.1 hypothetical protein BHS06_15205 [Myxococcus xanthus]QPM82715.1 hypothetical protein I5Q59_16200 [Myxococcus xanthus]
MPMNRSLLALVPLVGSLLLAGCGPSAGGDCDGGGFVCQERVLALECRGGKWRELPCRGPLGCRETSEAVRCDTSNNVAGDACASSAEGTGLCRADGQAVLECRQGVLTETATCSACTVENSQVTCQP